MAAPFTGAAANFTSSMFSRTPATAVLPARGVTRTVTETPVLVGVNKGIAKNNRPRRQALVAFGF